MNLSELLEDGGKDLVIIYPGRFHPFHIGHGKVYKYLKQKYSNAKVFISTSGKVDGDRSPFTFEEKRKMMILAGVSASDIVQTKSPYQSIEIMERFDKDKTVVVFAVSEKDMAEDPRFDFSNGLKLKKNGEPAYLQKWNNLNDAETFATRGYIATTPTFKFKVRGQEINSASQIRNMIAQSDDTKLTQMLQDLYSITDVPDDIIEIFKRKVGNKETMNENWDEHSFYKFLQESINEENTMKDGILQTLTEGKSPHKKGTKKYNAHMAAIHAESYDEEFDAKVKQVVESKLKNVAADIKDYVDDHKEHFDAYPMDVEVNGKVYDFDEYWKILDLVYPDSYDNKYAVEGKEQLEEAFVLAPWILPALATAVRVGAPALKLLLKGGKKAAPKVKDTTTNMIQKSTASGVIVGAVGKTVYDKVGDAIDGIKKIFGIDMDEDALNIFAQIVVKYGIPMAAIGAVLYGGKQLKDYMAGEEEKQTGNTTINNYYNGEPAKEAYNENYANDQHEKLEYIHHVLQECGDGNMDITMVEQALEYVEDIREQHFNADGSTKSESVNEDEVSVDNEGNVVGYLDTIDEYVAQLFKLAPELGMEGATAKKIAYRIQNAVDDIRTRELNLAPSNIRSQHESVNEAGGEFAQPIYDLINDLGGDNDAHEIVLNDMVRYLGSDTIKDFVADFRRNNDLNHPGEDGDYGDDDKNFESVKEATHSDAKPIYDLVGSLGAGKIELAKNPIFHNLVRFLDADTIEKFVADFRKKLDNGDSMNEEAIVNEDHDIGLLKAVARQMEEDAHKGDYTAIEELLQDVTEEEMKAFLSDHRSSNEWPEESVNEAQVLAHGGKGQYKAVSDGGVVRIMHKGKEIASGDFDSGADGWFVSREDDKGQKFFSNAQDMVDFFAEQKVNEWVQDSPAQGFSGQERNFIQELCLRMDGVSKSPEGLKWMGKSETWDEGNVLSNKGKLTTVMLWAKKNIDDLYHKMGSEFKVYSDGNDKGDSGRGQSDGNQIMQNIIKKIGKVTEDTLDVTPKGYGPDDYDEKDVPPEDHGGDLKKMQDTYKYNEDRNNHSENILMLAQAFGDRGEIRAVEGLLKIIKRQGYTTPEQSDMMYKAIHKKYYSQLFPAENEGNKFSGELEKAKIDGKKEFKVDGKTYKVKEALSKLLDSQKTNEAGIMHYSDAKGTPEYKEGQKAAKNDEPYDSNPYSGAEKLKWSKGHNEWRHANKRKKGKPNFGARGQFE